jgi:hypothetical protein
MRLIKRFTHKSLTAKITKTEIKIYDHEESFYRTVLATSVAALRLPRNGEGQRPQSGQRLHNNRQM